MDWYSKLDSRANYICIVPESVDHCEKNKATFHHDNELTDQAYGRVMAEAEELLQSLNKQRELLDIDNSESVTHVEHLIKDIGEAFFIFMFLSLNLEFFFWNVYGCIFRIVY